MVSEGYYCFEQSLKQITISCPQCHKIKKISVPIQAISQNKQLTTISIPAGLVCLHHFQAFIDGNYKIRSYQKVDFQLPTLEFFEEDTNYLNSHQNLKEIIKFLRKSAHSNEIIGVGFFTSTGKVLYSSLSVKSLIHTISEIKIRTEKNLRKIENIIVEFEENQKICTKVLEINSKKYIIVLLFTASKNNIISKGDLILEELAYKLINLN